MESFYGGRPGFSCIIVKFFSSIAEMIKNFKLGGDYSDVHYNESVLINTTNKNDPDNGKVYRRGYSYQDNMGGAIYVGTIVGPAGRAPHLELSTIEEVEQKKNRVDYDSRYTEGHYTVTNDSLVPGKTSNGNYNDQIDWVACSVRDLNGEDTTAYIGFRIPYLVEEFISESVSAYYKNPLVVRQDGGEHPFYQKWKINIPKGIKGDAFKDFRVIPADDTIKEYDGKSDDVTNHRKVLVYDYYHYDNNENGEPVTIYLGDYNMIDGITIGEDGTVTIDYSHDNDKVYNKLFKWIKKVTLDKDTGRFTVEYNQETDKDGNPTKYETDLRWVKDVVLAANGTITLKYSSGSDTTLTQKIKWISKITIGTDGTVTVEYNDGTNDTFTKKVKWISNVTINTNDGKGNQKVHVTYNTGEESDIGDPLNFIIDTAIDEKDYHYIVYYSDPELRAAKKAEGKTRSYNGKDDWVDLGSVHDDDGILIGLNVDTDIYPELASTVAAIDYLNENYPNGLEGVNLQGKIVTVGSGTAPNDKVFYGFNYEWKDDSRTTYKGWYYLGTFQNTVSQLYMIAEESDPEIKQKQQELMIGGLWFVSEVTQ